LVRGDVKMLTENMIEQLARLTRLAPYMDKEWQGKLLDLIRDLKAAEAEGTFPASAIGDLVKAVGDQQVRDIVNDLRSAGRTVPGFLPQLQKSLEEVNKPDPPKDDTPSYLKPDKGWVKEQSVERSMAQTEIFDEMVSALVGGSNDTSKLR
jgi:hypothetical protein